ncbi:hypothetical protein KOI35_11760 [Actinoplanes bogorensis]|uniref:TolB protein n=1 Tax=Paractinoplanes bogorensis TaxID=1610840 RepID=A0ABS5YL16_9ACTN|nr:hypothetical protein [Actinoplanes bogorensis]MBU2664169.1 hypothetical protein [Actinoplanes bogorensis]
MSRTLVIAVAMTALVTGASPSWANGRTEASGRIVWINAPDTTFTTGHLETARPDGRDGRRLTPDTPGARDILPSISPDGRRVLYQRDSGEQADLRIVDVTGRNDHTVDTGCRTPCADDLEPGWLPDGRIFFTRVIGPFDQPNNSARSAVLHTARPDGTDVRRLSPPGPDGLIEDYHASTAPGAGYLVYFRLRNADSATALFRMDLPDRRVRQLTSWSLPVDGPDLSPARRGPTRDLIVFQVARPGTDALAVATVPATCVSEADCMRRIRYLTGTTGRATTPSWSPDGRRIAFSFRTSATELNGDVWTMRPDGSDRRRVSTSPAFDYGADWGPA